jgi:hypothetical protein
MKRFALALLASIALAGCGGGGGGGTSTPKTNPTATPSGTTSKVSITIAWPGSAPASSERADAARRKPDYISPSTGSVVLYLDGTAVATIANPCNQGTVVVSPASKRRTAAACTQTTTTITAGIGYHTFSATGFTGTTGTGTALSTSVNPTGYTVTNGGANVVTVTMNGIVTAMSLGTLTVSGTSVTVPINALDAGGNVITGTYANAITVSLVDPGGQYSGTSKTITASGSTMPLTWTKTADCTAQLQMYAPAVSTLSTAVSYPQSITTGTATATAGFGRVGLCWPVLGTTATYSVYRGNTSGGEQLLGTVPYGTTTYQDYTAYSGATYYYKICTGSLTSTCTAELTGSPSSDPNKYFGTSPTYWYDLNDATTVSATTINDKSPNGFNLTINFMTTPSNAVNGRVSLLSNPNNSYATVAKGALNPAGPGLTFFIVASQTGAPGTGSTEQRLINIGYNDNGQGVIGTNSPAGAANGVIAEYYGNGTTFNCGSATGCVTPKAQVGNGTQWQAVPSVLTVINDGNSTAAFGGTGKGAYNYFNGTSIGNVADVAGIPSTTGMEIGSYSLNSTYNIGWNGYISEIIVYPLADTITTAQRQKIEGYLACKWGFQNLLPAGAPGYQSGTTSVACP